ncbi:MAG: fasciclin domain-containing protein [Granulosicoccus sp.]
MKHLFRAGLFTGCLIAVAACSDNSSPDPAVNLAVQDEATGNVLETINSQPEFTILSDAMARSGLDSALADTNRRYTLFAPTDAAFSGLGETTLSNLFSDASALSYILSYHFLPGMVVDSTTATAFAGTNVPAANGVTLEVSLAPSRYNANPQAVYVNDAEVFVGDVPATNGVIHVVDRVLLPPGVGETGGGGTDGGGTDGGGTDGGGTDGGGTDGGGTDGGGTDGGGTDGGGTDGGGTDGGGTDGGGTDGGGTDGGGTDGGGTDGGGTDGGGTDGGGTDGGGTDGGGTDGGGTDGGGTDGGGTDGGGTDGGGTDGGGTDGGGTDGGSASLMEAIAADGDLDTLVDALRRTGLDSLLSDTSRKFTIFAPTDTAFGIYDPFEAILNDTDKLEETLRYHVVADDEIDLNELSDLSGTRVTMANDDTVFISSFQGSLFLNFYARVEATEIRATNGVIHKLNGLLFSSN